jgi:putative acetyltransferase
VTLRVRPALEEDKAAIRAVLTAAFPSSAEAELVERLAGDGDLVFGFCAVDEGEVVGYAAFSRMTVVADDARVPALALGPVAVVPERQRRGIGGQLLESGLAAANGRGIHLVFVLGEPDFYGRFGFRAQTAAPFASPYAGPHFMAQWLSSPRAPASGRADYAPAFVALG